MHISYQDLNNKVQNTDGLVRTLALLDKAITCVTVALYSGLLAYGIYLWVMGQGLSCLYGSLFVPGLSFVMISIFRVKYGARRPYEIYNYKPALKKDTVGKSFPSRHVFSIFMVAMAYSQVSLPIVILLCILGLMLGAIRVIGGVHFIKDVVAGMLMALIIGFICYGLYGGTFNGFVLPF